MLEQALPVIDAIAFVRFAGNRPEALRANPKEDVGRCVPGIVHPSPSLMRLLSQQAGEVAVNFSGVFADSEFLANPIPQWR
jgi:hypothetical protein